MPVQNERVVDIIEAHMQAEQWLEFYSSGENDERHEEAARRFLKLMRGCDAELEREIAQNLALDIDLEGDQLALERLRITRDKVREALSPDKRKNRKLA